MAEARQAQHSRLEIVLDLYSGSAVANPRYLDDYANSVACGSEVKALFGIMPPKIRATLASTRPVGDDWVHLEVIGERDLNDDDLDDMRITTPDGDSRTTDSYAALRFILDNNFNGAAWVMVEGIDWRDSPHV